MPFTTGIILDKIKENHYKETVKNNALIVLFYMANNNGCFNCVIFSWQTIMNVLIVMFYMANNNECFNCVVLHGKQ